MLPFFFESQPFNCSQTVPLSEATSRHCIQVLRMTNGSRLVLTDGQGRRSVATIKAPDRKRCVVTIQESKLLPAPEPHLAIGIAFTKSKSRNEWFLEKATEIGIRRIFPLLVTRSEKDRFNMDRYRQVLIAAMLQSQQYHLPELLPPQKLSSFLKDITDRTTQRFIAHCNDQTKKSSLSHAFKKGTNSLVLIGPEGDFTPQEVEQCLQSGFIPVTLGQHRLRTETAGIYACTLFNAFQDD